ncbi:hypothetical protein JTE90_028593 [Oedothorax gibbosus]|uniref:Uncharacterized protein n=1 Tax=Oedothorax gibbosus TaxID=931172 RepID=A0AAV6TZ24_9ARAC|nr:hypothetical protein JTE90_028593 [Oedothorax gibbosus]
MRVTFETRRWHRAEAGLFIVDVSNNILVSYENRNILFKLPSSLIELKKAAYSKFSIDCASPMIFQCYNESWGEYIDVTQDHEIIPGCKYRIMLQLPKLLFDKSEEVKRRKKVIETSAAISTEKRKYDMKNGKKTESPEIGLPCEFDIRRKEIVTEKMTVENVKTKYPNLFSKVELEKEFYRPTVCNEFQEQGPASPHIGIVGVETNHPKFYVLAEHQIVIELNTLPEAMAILMATCRHHILEIIATAVFDRFFTSSGPQVALFGRFKEYWHFLDLSNYAPIDKDTSHCVLTNDEKRGFELKRHETVEFLHAQLKNQPRHDYLEFIKLSLITLGETESIPTNTNLIGLVLIIEQGGWRKEFIA